MNSDKNKYKRLASGELLEKVRLLHLNDFRGSFLCQLKLCQYILSSSSQSHCRKNSPKSCPSLGCEKCSLPLCVFQGRPSAGDCEIRAHFTSPSDSNRTRRDFGYSGAFALFVLSFADSLKCATGAEIYCLRRENGIAAA